MTHPWILLAICLTAWAAVNIIGILILSTI
jgi:hypothetical protein